MASKFITSIDAFVEKANVSLAGGAKAALTEMIGAVIARSPVGTPETSDHPGAFRGNWHVGANISEGFDSSVRDLDGASTLETCKAALEGFDFLSDFHLFIYNRAPYGVRLEYGWSLQAPSPPGIIRVAALMWTDIVREVFVLGGGAEAGVPSLSLVSV